MKILQAANQGENAPPVTLGFARFNILQLFFHFVIAICIGVSLRLTTFTEATTIAATISDHYRVKTSFLVSFGFTKACSNLIVGYVADVHGRKAPHSFGWVFGILLGIILLILYGATVDQDSDKKKQWMLWYIIANICLGAQQGWTWTTNIFMFIDILGPKHRALASSISNSVGYLSSAVTTYAAASLSARSAFQLVLGTSIFGWIIAMFFLKDTTRFVEQEINEVKYKSATMIGTSSVDKNGALRFEDCVVEGEDLNQDADLRTIENVGDTSCSAPNPQPFELDLDCSNCDDFNDVTTSFGTVLARTCWQNKSTAILCVAGLMANLTTSLAWGLVLIWGKQQNLSPLRLANIGSAFTFAKGTTMVLSGYISDRQGDRKRVLMSGFLIVSIGLAVTATADLVTDQDVINKRLLFGGIVIGTGLGSVYCVMTAAMSDHTAPLDRASAIGVYKFWRDSGYAFGGLLTGCIADASGGSFVLPTMVVSALTGVLVVGFYRCYHEVVYPGRTGATF